MIMDEDQISPRHLLPEPSIMKKIEDLHPGSASEIFKNFKNIADHRRSEESRAFKPLGLKETFKRVFCGHPTPQESRTAFAALNRDWAVTGDDLRAAINDYIETHALADKLVLTEVERESLGYIARHFTRNHPRPAVPACK